MVYQRHSEMLQLTLKIQKTEGELLSFDLQVSRHQSACPGGELCALHQWYLVFEAFRNPHTTFFFCASMN